ncbi:hypothetical protein [Ornithinibacillus scapharcae]|uniref:hypothetical protein n=1 Tax=Ornithinibacillus scapharcae TaxID=1147159 RepID=UPI000225B3EF|nr:hypothetical protein [Ornithinibacillus scapharcae]
MDFHPTDLHILAKKYKRLFEKYSINAAGYQVNDKEFYWVNYYRFGKMVGHAVISPNVAKDQDYKEAFNYLSKSAQLRSNLSSDGGFRANINMRSFEVMEKFFKQVLEEVDLDNDREVIEGCRNTMQRILKLQERLVELYKSYYQQEIKIQEGTEKFHTNEYLEFVLDCTCEIDYIQYTQLNLQYEMIPSLKYIRKLINKVKHLKELMNPEIKVYLGEFINSETDLRKSIRNVTYTSELNKQLSLEKHMEIIRKVLLQSVQDVTEEIVKELRFPELK